jgi:hypothetical protein
MSTTLESHRSLALLVGYVATDWNPRPRYTAYVQSLSDWDVLAIMRNGISIGACYRRNGEVHCSILPAFRRRWATRGLLREIFSGENRITQVTPGHDYMYGILARLGFEHVPSGTYRLRPSGLLNRS